MRRPVVKYGDPILEKVAEPVTNFNTPEGNRSSSSYGTITSTFPARQVQFALKLVF